MFWLYNLQLMHLVLKMVPLKPGSWRIYIQTWKHAEEEEDHLFWCIPLEGKEAFLEPTISFLSVSVKTNHRSISAPVPGKRSGPPWLKLTLWERLGSGGKTTMAPPKLPTHWVPKTMLLLNRWTHRLYWMLCKGAQCLTIQRHKPHGRRPKAWQSAALPAVCHVPSIPKTVTCGYICWSQRNKRKDKVPAFKDFKF